MECEANCDVVESAEPPTESIKDDLVVNSTCSSSSSIKENDAIHGEITAQNFPHGTIENNVEDTVSSPVVNETNNLNLIVNVTSESPEHDSAVSTTWSSSALKNEAVVISAHSHTPENICLDDNQDSELTADPSPKIQPVVYCPDSGECEADVEMIQDSGHHTLPLQDLDISSSNICEQEAVVEELAVGLSDVGIDEDLSVTHVNVYDTEVMEKSDNLPVECLADELRLAMDEVSVAEPGNVDSLADELRLAMDEVSVAEPDDVDSLADELRLAMGEVSVAGPDNLERSATDDANMDMIKMLKAELMQRQADVYTAAEVGKALLEANVKKDQQLEAIISETTAKFEVLEQEKHTFQQNMEALEQEKHSLQQRLDHKTCMEASIIEEVELLKEELRKQKQEYNEVTEAEHAKCIAELKSQVSRQQTELEQTQLSCRQHQDRCSSLDTMLKEARDQLEHKINLMNETCSEEMAQLHTDLNTLQNEKIELRCELNEARHAEQQYQQAVERAQQLLNAKEEEVEEKQCQATAYYNSLERLREENQELKVQLDIIRMEAQNVKKKGNSLFSEVEDRRVAAEKTLISLKVKYDALEKQFKITRQYEHALKTQISILLQKASNTADLNHMEHLQQELSYARSEIKQLHCQISEMEKRPQKLDVKTELYDAWCANMDRSKSSGMAFFEARFRKKEVELEDLQSRLKTTRLQMLAENQKVLQQESQIYANEKEIEKQRNMVIKLSLKLDEYKMKYEPERQQSLAASGKGKVEKIPIPKKTDGKENKPDQQGARPKVTSNSKALPDSTTDESRKILQEHSLPKPSTLLPNPIMKSMPKKKVSVSEDIKVIQHKGETPNTPQTMPADSSQSGELSAEGHIVKGRPKGRRTYHNVKKVEDASECKQQ